MVLQLSGKAGGFWGEVGLVREIPPSSRSHQLGSQDTGELAVHRVGKGGLRPRAVRGLEPLLDFIEEREGSGSFEILEGRKRTNHVQNGASQG